MRRLALVFVLAAACGGADDDDDTPTLDDFLPEVPAPTGEAQATWAGPITADNAEVELIDGPARSGMVGDFYMRNAAARFVIQSPARVIGVVPQGGNLVDAVALDDNGGELSDDHFGELSSVYQVLRTCEHDTIEILQDGSGGGAAVIRARGRSGVNDFVNIKGIGLLSIPPEIDGDVADNVECATTYVLQPGSPELLVYWTFFNPDELGVVGPFGALNDTGGETEQFAPTRGFERAGIDSLTTLTEPAPIDYVLYQGPGVAYGVIPMHDNADATNSAVVIAGVSVMLYGVDALLDILREDGWFFQLPGLQGVTHRAVVVVGRDAASIEAHYQRLHGNQVAAVSGTVAWASGDAPVGARVGLYQDTNGNSALDDDDLVISYFDADSAGAFSGEVAPGNYLVRAEVKDRARSDALAITVPAADVGLSLPDPVYYDFSIVDDATDMRIPGRITIIGEHPAHPDGRIFETSDRKAGTVTAFPAPHGGSVDIGDGADERIALAPGSTYKILASRGTEWSVASAVVSPTAGDPVGELELRMRHVAPTPGYLATEFHQHSVGSPDSPVGRPMRVATFVGEGVEFFASTDHDYVTDFQPLIEALGMQRFVRAIPGLEITPFAYGHFQAWPIEPMPNDPSGGAIDWAQGTQGYAMIPSEIFAKARDRGAEVIQVNHPRAEANDFSDMMQYFDRAGLVFDYDTRVISGDPLRAPVPNDWLRLPEASIWDDSFNALEVWNGFNMKDSNEDGVREIGRLDTVMRDWFNFLSFGKDITPIGNSDSHTVVKDPIGMPQTFVRVANDDPSAIESGTVTDDVLDTLSGLGGAPKDIVVTNGPHLEVAVADHEGSALGAVIDGSGGTVSFTVTVVAPAWAQVDTLEVFVNDTPDSFKKEETWMQPSLCFTGRELASLAENDPCALAPLGTQTATFELVSLPGPGSFQRYEATVTFDLTAADVATVNRAGASGSDAWVVVRVSGARAVFPLLTDGAITNDNLAILVEGDEAAIDEALYGIGVPAAAFTSPVYVDFDGGGYTAPFAP